MRCTPAERATTLCSKPWCTRYAIARSLYNDAKTSLIAIRTLSIPRIFKKVSCCPAKEASGKSSAVAEERTATAMSGLPFESAANASRISCSNAAVSGVSTIHLRIFAPVSASASTSSTFS